MTDEAWQRTATTNQFRRRVSLKAASTPFKYGASLRRELRDFNTLGTAGRGLCRAGELKPIPWVGRAAAQGGLGSGAGDTSVRAGRDPLHSEHSHTAQRDGQTLTKPPRMALLQPREGKSNKKFKNQFFEFSVSNLIEPAVHSSTELG